MSFPRSIKEDALVKSQRHCCVCHTFAGRDADVHHIIPEADGGPDTLDNAIVLCFRCHSEAGHYNPRHPMGNKYSPSELRRHRDWWWGYCENHPGSWPSSQAPDILLPELTLKLFQLGRDQRHKGEITFSQGQYPSSRFEFGLALENAKPIVAEHIYVKASFYWRGDYPGTAPQIQAPSNTKGWITDVSQLVNEQWAMVSFDGGSESKCLADHPVRWKDFSIVLRERINGYFDIHYVVSSVRPYTHKNARLRINMK